MTPTGSESVNFWNASKRKSAKRIKFVCVLPERSRATDVVLSGVCRTSSRHTAVYCLDVALSSIAHTNENTLIMNSGAGVNPGLDGTKARRGQTVFPHVVGEISLESVILRMQNVALITTPYCVLRFENLLQH